MSWQAGWKNIYFAVIDDWCFRIRSAFRLPLYPMFHLHYEILHCSLSFLEIIISAGLPLV